MTTASASAIEIDGVTKAYGGGPPLVIRRLVIDLHDRVALFGFDRSAAEMFIHLITGAALPDEGSVRIDGRDTRDIATDTEWLASLDRFGIVTDRAVLIEKLPIAANMALPLTLTIDPMRDETRVEVDGLADLVGLPRARLDAPATSLSAVERVRVHLARAVAPCPALLLLEHPTAAVEDVSARRDLGVTLRAAADAKHTGWIALTEDAVFARAAGGRRLRLVPATGELAGDGLWEHVRSLWA